MQIEFIGLFGHIISTKELKPNQDNINKVKNAEIHTKKEILSFLAINVILCKLYPKQGYSAIVAPLTELMKRGLPNIVEVKVLQDKACHTLKNIITTSPILHLPDFRKGFYLQTDALSIRLGAILVHEMKGKFFPISFACKKLHKT